MRRVNNSLTVHNTDAYMWWCEADPQTYIDPEGRWIDFNKALKEYNCRNHLPSGCFSEDLSPNRNDKSNDTPDLDNTGTHRNQSND